MTVCLHLLDVEVDTELGLPRLSTSQPAENDAMPIRGYIGLRVLRDLDRAPSTLTLSARREDGLAHR